MPESGWEPSGHSLQFREHAIALLVLQRLDGTLEHGIIVHDRSNPSDVRQAGRLSVNGSPHFRPTVRRLSTYDNLRTLPANAFDHDQTVDCLDQWVLRKDGGSPRCPCVVTAF